MPMHYAAPGTRPVKSCTLAALLLLNSHPGAAREPWEHDWIEVRSPNFVVASEISERRTVELIENLENFRWVITDVTSAKHVDAPIPTHILVFARRLKDIGLDDDVAGYFDAGLRENHAVILASSKIITTEVMQHEYVHFVIRNQAGPEYPPWFDEGFAEFLSAIKVRRGRYEYGNIPQVRVHSLFNGQWIKFSTLLAVRDARELGRLQREMFYAQSWALVHYLLLGRSSRDFGADNNAFLKLSSEGTSPVAAFEQAFGISTDTLRRELQRYLSGTAGYYKVRPKEPFPVVQTSVRRLAGDEIATRIALLCLARADHAAAKRYLDAALAANPDNARALVGLAHWHASRDDYVQAEPLYERAIGLQPDDALPHLDYAEYLSARAFRAQSPEERRDWLSKARRHFVRSHALDDANPETLVAYGATFLMPGEAPAKGLDTLEAAHALLPAHPHVKLTLASLYATMERYDDARRLVRQVLSWADVDSIEAAEELLAWIEAATGQPFVPPPWPIGPAQ